MSDHSTVIPAIPKETVRAANAIFGRSNFYILIGERLGTILEDLRLHCSPERQGIAKIQGAILALITLFQFVEGLTDVQATDALRSRIDWKFALHLSLLPVMLHESDLCEFRHKMLMDSANQHEFQKLIDRIIMFVPSLNNIFRNLKCPEILSFVCLVNCLNRAQQTMNQVLEVLAARFPDWLRKIALPHWYGRYSYATPRLDVAILLGQHRFFMEEIGADIHHLLAEIHRSGSRELGKLQEVKALDQVYSQQFQTQVQNEKEKAQIKLCPMNCSSCPGRMETWPAQALNHQ